MLAIVLEISMINIESTGAFIFDMLVLITALIGVLFTKQVARYMVKSNYKRAIKKSPELMAKFEEMGGARIYYWTMYVGVLIVSWGALIFQIFELFG